MFREFDKFLICYTILQFMKLVLKVQNVSFNAKVEDKQEFKRWLRKNSVRPLLVRV